MDKRHLFILPAIVVAMASCTSETEQDTKAEQQKPIAFATYLGEISGTRATHIASSDDPATLKGYDFKQVGFSLYANVNEASTGKVKPFMNDQDIVWDDANSQWVYAPIKYWPTEEASTVDFYPRYKGWTEDDKKNIVNTYDWNNIPQVTFYVNDVVSKQTDYIWAAPILGAKSSDYPNDQKVKFSFRHALSAFTFKMQVEGYNKDVTRIGVNSVTLTGQFAPKATLNPKETDISKIWNLQGDWGTRSYTISVDGDNEVIKQHYSEEPQWITKLGSYKYSDTNEYGKGTIMVLPYGDSYTVTLNYYVITYPTKTDKDNFTNGVTEYYTVSKEVTGTPIEAGKIYINTIKLTLKAITVDATVSSWSNFAQGVDIN